MLPPSTPMPQGLGLSPSVVLEPLATWTVGRGFAPRPTRWLPLRMSRQSDSCDRIAPGLKFGKLWTFR